MFIPDSPSPATGGRTFVKKRKPLAKRFACINTLTNTLSMSTTTPEENIKTKDKALPCPG